LCTERVARSAQTGGTGRAGVGGQGCPGKSGVGHWGGMGTRGPRVGGALTLFGRQGVLLLRLRFLQLGLIEAGDFPHVRLVCHFLKTILAGKPTRLAWSWGPAPPPCTFRQRLSTWHSCWGVPGSPEAEDLGAFRTLLQSPRAWPASQPWNPIREGRLLRLPRTRSLH
jgi:hypothetical protein